MVYNTLSLYTDGSSKGNPGPAMVGVVVKKGDKTILKISQSIGQATNNEAEYKALILGLERVKKLKPQELICYLDSQLVVKQLNRELAPLFVRAWNLSQDFKKIKFVHIGREYNKDADKMTKK